MWQAFSNAAAVTSSAADAVAQQRHDVGEHVVARGAVEGVEVERGAGGGGGGERDAHRGAHCGTTRPIRIRHTVRESRPCQPHADKLDARPPWHAGATVDGHVRPRCVPAGARRRPGGAVRRGREASPDLWATVNVCDTAEHPNEIGVRASMPGRPRGTLRWMRFRLQYQDGDRWRYVKGADSGWGALQPRARAPDRVGLDVPVRHARAPRSPSAGVVRFQWRRDGEVVRRARRLHRGRARLHHGRRPGGLLRRHLLDRVAAEQPRVVGDHAR